MESDHNGKTRVVTLRGRSAEDRSASDASDIELQRQSLQLVRAFFRIASKEERQKVVDLASYFANES